MIARYRRMGVAGQMVRHYVEESRKRGQDGVVLTCKDHLRPLYEKAGFIWQGVSASTHGGVKWNDMLLSLPKRRIKEMKKLLIYLKTYRKEACLAPNF